jgi:long-subunit acyl-CoA synthetase (AMP-forming)
VTITDRKKELIITSSGKNIAPTRIEGLLKEHPLIGQAVAIGDRRPYNVALVVLDPDACGPFAAQERLPDPSPQALAVHPEVRVALAAAVEAANGHLSRVERIKRFAVLADEWLPGGDELTPTMKLKRRSIAEKYAAEIDRLYEGA